MYTLLLYVSRAPPPPPIYTMLKERTWLTCGVYISQLMRLVISTSETSF